MAIDFRRLGTTSSSDTVLHPRKIFRLLPKKTKKYQYPRDVQTEVWNQWFARKEEKDIVLKMNTGAGKTVVGLLILKSCLNENKGPAVYVAPDPYLVQQVIQEGDDLGIELTENPRSPRFLRGKAILVINIYKLINGKSVFGVEDEGIKIGIGSIIIDDTHACLSTTEDQFTLITEKGSDCYNELFPLFKDDLYKQSETKALDVESQDNGAYMQIPFWCWAKNINAVNKVFYKYREEQDSIKFTLPLIKSTLKFCRCVVGEGSFETSPRCLPISVIPSFANADRRIFMTATLAEDSVLLTHFEADINSIKNPISPENADDIGERMIIIPQELNPTIIDDQIKNFLNTLSKSQNIVVIVPSWYRSTFWEDVSSLTLSSENLLDGVEKLKTGHVGLVVVVNKYDGIDLPYDACRILVIDGLPDIRRKIDKIEQGMLYGSSEMLSRLIQRIEQGMGRGIRSNDDYCVVFLMGASLTSHLYHRDALSKFSPATRAQFELSERLAEQIRDKDIEELNEIINYCLGRNTDWIKASKGALVGIKSDAGSTINNISLKQREAFDSAVIGNFEKAISSIQELVNLSTNKRVKGWLKQQLAEFTHFINPVEAQEILKSGVQDNKQIIHSIEGIRYSKLRSSTDSQAQLCSDFLRKSFASSNEFIIKLNSILEDLIFLPDTSNKFERAVKEMAFFIGFISQRPESEFGKGPDVLWGVGQLNYFVIECKNGATTDFIKKHDCDQLSGSMNWFNQNYDTTCTAKPLLIHSTNLFEKHGSPHLHARVMTKDKLLGLKEALLAFAKALSYNENFCDQRLIEKNLLHFDFTPEKFLTKYSVKYKIQS